MQGLDPAQTQQPAPRNDPRSGSTAVCYGRPMQIKASEREWEILEAARAATGATSRTEVVRALIDIVELALDGPEPGGGEELLESLRAAVRRRRARGLPAGSPRPREPAGGADAAGGEEV